LIDKELALREAMGCLQLHIGNEPILRLAYSKKVQKPIKNRGSYYPFGLQQKGYNYNVSGNQNSTAEKFKYNGIEQEQALGLNLYEMPLRQYDPAIARFTSLDPVVHHSYSTFSAFDNNPVFWADPSGADAIQKGVKYTGQDAVDIGSDFQDQARASSRDEGPDDVIYINRKSKTFSVRPDDEETDIVYDGEERSIAESGVTQANLLEQGFTQVAAPEGVGMGAVDGAILYLTGEAVFAWIGRGISIFWGGRVATNAFVDVLPTIQKIAPKLSKRVKSANFNSVSDGINTAIQSSNITGGVYQFNIYSLVTKEGFRNLKNLNGILKSYINTARGAGAKTLEINGFQARSGFSKELFERAGFKFTQYEGGFNATLKL